MKVNSASCWFLLYGYYSHVCSEVATSGYFKSLSLVSEVLVSEVSVLFFLYFMYFLHLRLLFFFRLLFRSVKARYFWSFKSSGKPGSVPSCSGPSTPGLLDPEVTSFRSHSFNDPASHPRRLETLSSSLFLRIFQCKDVTSKRNTSDVLSWNNE